MSHRLVALLALVLLATAGIAGPAAAQYPGGQGIACSTSTVLAGETFTCQADGFAARSTVTVTATGETTGASTTRSTAAAGQWTYETTVTANTSGLARAVIQTPDNAVGSTLVRFAGTDPSGDARVLSNATAVTVTQPVAGDGEPAPAPVVPDGDPAAAPGEDDIDAPAADGLAATGSDVAFWLGVVAVLLVLGATLLFVGRRRRADAKA